MGDSIVLYEMIKELEERVSALEDDNEEDSDDNSDDEDSEDYEDEDSEEFKDDENEEYKDWFVGWLMDS